MVPKKIFFTKGVGKHKERLTSFELALRDAGIASQNLVRVSSIFPPQCKVIPRKEGLTYLNHGEVVFSVIAENSTREPHRLIVSSIGVAIPADRNTYGYLSEHHSFGETEDQAGEYAEELAAEMLATTLDVDFDPDTSWDEKKEIYRISNKIVRTSNVTQSAVGDKRGLVDDDDCRRGADSGRVRHCMQTGVLRPIPRMRGWPCCMDAGTMMEGLAETMTESRANIT